MKLWIVSELGQEYNDAYYSVQDAGIPKKAFRSKESAVREKELLEKAATEDCDAKYYWDRVIPKEFYRIDEIEVADSDP